MAGLRGFSRLPRTDDPRARRNSTKLATDISFVGGGNVVTVDGDGFLTITLGNGLANSSGTLVLSLVSAGGLEFDSGDLRIKLDGTTLQTVANGVSVVTANLAAATELAKGVVFKSAARANSSQSAITLTGVTTTITDPGDTPVDADALRDDLEANTIPSIESALDELVVQDGELEASIETLAGEFNDLLAKLRTAGILTT